MKIASYTVYGGPETIAFSNAPIPSPAAGEVLIRVRAAPVTAGDARLRSGKVPRGLLSNRAFASEHVLAPIVFKKGNPMKLHSRLPLLLLLPVCGVFYGCATGNSSSAPPADAGNKAEQKISMAIGEEVGTFSISSQKKIGSPGGTDATQYTVKTKAGKTFKCDIFEPSGFGKVMSWGMASGSSATCTDFTAGSADQGKTNKASCNALLKAAGKC